MELPASFASKEEILAHLSSLKLYEKDIAALKLDLEKWQKREALAREKGIADLTEAAGKQVAEIQAKLSGLETEAAALGNQIEEMKRNLPEMAARERSIDPDLLEQEFRIMLGEDMGK
jgi:phage shock protein A